MITNIQIMSPIQELTNALSMFFAIAICWYYICTQTSNLQTICITIGTTLHFPASFAYHAYCSCSSDIYTAEVIKKIDISMIYISSIFYAFATSKSIPYTIGCLLYTLFAIWYLVQQKGLGIHKMKRAASVGVCVILYTTPIVFLGNIVMYKYVIGSFASASTVYIIRPFGGWSHTVFHILLVVFQYYILCATNI